MLLLFGCRDCVEDVAPLPCLSTVEPSHHSCSITWLLTPPYNTPSSSKTPALSDMNNYSSIAWVCGILRMISLGAFLAPEW